MTSVLNVDTIAAKDGTSPVGLTKQTAAKFFFAFRPDSSNTIDASFNHSSLTDNGTGDFTCSFTNSFNGAEEYILSGSVYDGGASTIAGVMSDTLLTGSVRFSTCSTSAFIDRAYTHAVIHGDLA